MDNVRIAWTIFKLKVVRVLLRPLMRLHIWYLSKDKLKTDMQGPDPMMEYLINKPKKGGRNEEL